MGLLKIESIASELGDYSKMRMLLSRVLLTLCALAIPYFFIFYFSGLTVPSLCVIPIVLSYAVALFVNRLNKVYLSVIILIISTSIGILYYACILHKESQAQLILFALIVIPLLMLPPNRKDLIVTGVMIPICCIGILEATNYSVFPAYTLTDSFVRFVSGAASITSGTIIILSILFLNDVIRKSQMALQESNAELTKSNGELRETMAQLKESEELNEHLFVSATYAAICKDLAHEFKNPLNMLQGAGAVLIRKYQSDPVLVDLGERLDATTSRLHRLTETMLKYGGQAPSSAPFSLDELLTDIHTFAAIEAKSKHIDWQLTTNPPLVLNGDRDMIYQAILNLIVNAFSHTPTGGHVILSSEFGSFHSTTAPNTPGICIRVSDTGSGIPPHAKDFIFSPKFTTKASASNAGLGLAIVLRTAIQHGGIAQLKSTGPQGSVFDIWLPLPA